MKSYTGLIASTDLWPSRDVYSFTCLDVYSFWNACAGRVSVPTSVIGGLRGFTIAQLWNHKGSFHTVTGNLAVTSQSFRDFITFRSRKDTTFFSFFEILFHTKLPFPLSWWSKDLLVENLQVGAGGGGGGGVNLEINLCSSSMISDCIWRLISIQYVPIEGGINSDLGNGYFWVKIRVAKHADHSWWT